MPTEKGDLELAYMLLDAIDRRAAQRSGLTVGTVLLTLRTLADAITLQEMMQQEGEDHAADVVKEAISRWRQSPSTN